MYLYLNMSNTENKECPICYEPINQNDLVKLKCGHEFHNDCIIFAYKTNLKTKNSHYTNLFKIRICPYCRRDGGFLECKLNEIPQQYIHKNYELFNLSLKNDDKDYYLKYLNPNKCLSILKSGLKKGNQCEAKPYCSDSLYCKRHYKLKNN